MAKGTYSQAQFGGSAMPKAKEGKRLSADTPIKSVTDWNKPPNPVHKK